MEARVRVRGKLWLALTLVGVWGCGGGGGSPSSSSNGAPSGSFTISPNSSILMGATSVNLTATGADPDGDALTYSWNFGDGSTGTGQSVAHVFASAGPLAVVLTIQDAKGAQVTVSNTVTVKSITGHWVDTDPRFQVDFVQTGSTFTGSVTVSGFGKVSDITSGRVTAPRNVAFHRQSSVAGFATVDYTGSLDTTLDRMDVVAIQTSATSFNLRRQ